VVIEDLADEVEALAGRFRFVRATIQLDQTRFSIKYRLLIKPDLWVQIYNHIQNHTVGLAFVYQGRRLYGRDCEAGNWHRHPVDDPENHDFSAEGARPTSVEEFLREVGQILVDYRLL
jgi:hypothetical protein